ncbi:hypothetical protein Q5M85_05635 [Paraclostridium bifermentans]|nr:hypothetical protein [Paraclostridium bifermentans]
MKLEIIYIKRLRNAERFCKGAWAGLKSKVEFLASGNNSPYVKQEGVAIHSCNDGLHPVIYKLEEYRKKADLKISLLINSLI